LFNHEVTKSSLYRFAQNASSAFVGGMYRIMDSDWHRITCFNGLGKTIAEHCEKAMKVLVHGRIHNTTWTDATGTNRYGCKIIAELVDRDDEIPF
jgi:single-stranded DNA-binding protein